MYFERTSLKNISLTNQTTCTLKHCIDEFIINKSKSAKNTVNVTLDEKPGILDISASVIWDGDQTLGGNWVSHPDVTSPERVLIKNISMENQSLELFFSTQKE